MWGFMNWRRGLLRVWLVAAICWAVATGLTIGLPRAIKTYWSFYDVPATVRADARANAWPGTPLEKEGAPVDEKLGALRELGRRLTIADETVLTFLWIGMTPPFGILVLGAALAFALKGFRQS